MQSNTPGVPVLTPIDEITSTYKNSSRKRSHVRNTQPGSSTSKNRPGKERKLTSTAKMIPAPKESRMGNGNDSNASRGTEPPVRPVSRVHLAKTIELYHNLESSTTAQSTNLPNL